MDTEKIIDHCLQAIRDYRVGRPVKISREKALYLINELYRSRIALAMGHISVFTYDGGPDFPEKHTADGVCLLPDDFLEAKRVYDGSPPKERPLKVIFDINDKVPDTHKVQQYMIPNDREMWIFGKNPSKTVKLYYIARPAALEDSIYSSPTELREEFHRDIFVCRIKEVYAEDMNDTPGMIDQRAKIEDLLDLIRKTYARIKQDGAPRKMKAGRWF
jgi:hypothetical protein